MPSTSDFAGIPGATYEHFLWALALSPAPEKEPMSFREIHREWPEAPPGIDTALELALDILVELGHLETTTTLHYNSANPDGIRVRQYSCDPAAEGQQKRVRSVLDFE